ncbi:uncharacterized protein LOC142348571 [Convolutriloba macropyga]|uniref:uncharacterized protein LOC142348571 n=1 Tax=Convolutriloba macropyga TaxID=536237 RepID=UPI003F51C76A
MIREQISPPLNDVTNHSLPTELKREYYENIFYISIPFTVLYMVIVPFISLRLFPILKLQNTDRRCSFVSDCISSIPSALTGFITIRSFIYYVPDNDRENMFEGFKWCTIFMSAYLFVDTIYRILYIESHRTMMVVHHIVGLVITQFAMNDRGWLIEKVIFCLMEVANPFINIRLMLLGIDFPKTSYRYLVASLLMIITFGLFRVVPIPIICRGAYYKLVVYPQYSSVYHKCMFSLYLLLSVMNLYWFYVMLVGLVKTARKLLIKNKKQEKSDKQN